MDDLVAEHLDHLHYINDILCLNIPDLNDVLTEHLLHKLLVPLYIYSLTSSVKRLPTSSPYNRDHIQSIEVITRNLEAILSGKNAEMSPSLNYPRQSRLDSEDESKPSVSCVVSLFLLSQVFLIITHGPIVHALAWILLQSDLSVFEDGATKILEMYISNAKSSIKLEFSKPQVSLEKALEGTSLDRDYTTPEYAGSKSFNYDTDHSSCDLDPELVSTSLPSTSHISETSSIAHDSTEDLVTQIHSAKSAAVAQKANMPDSPLPDSGIETLELNITDEEKQKLLGVASTSSERATPIEHTLVREIMEIEKRPFLKTIFDSLDCTENDYKALFALCLLFALINNKG